MKANDPQICFDQLKSIKNKIDWFFSCCLNNFIFRFGQSEIQILNFLDDQLGEVVIQQNKLNEQLQRAFQSEIKVLDSRILKVFNNEDYVFLIVEINGIQYFTFIDPESITQICCLLKPVRSFQNQMAIKGLLALKQLNYKIIYVKENRPSIIILCSHNHTLNIYEIRVESTIEIYLVSTFMESIFNSYFLADSYDFILATGRKLLFCEYQDKDQCSWKLKPFPLQNQFPTHLYMSEGNLIFLQLNEGMSQKSKGIAAIFYKVKRISNSKYRNEQVKIERTLQFINANKKVIKLQPKSEIKIKVIYESQMEILFLLFNKEQLHIVQKDKFDVVSSTKLQVSQQIVDVQITNNFSFLLFFESSYRIVQLRAAVQQLQVRGSSKVIKAISSNSEYLINSASRTPNQRNLQSSNIIFNNYKGKPQLPELQIQRITENLHQAKNTLFNTKQEEVIHQVTQQEQIDFSGKFSNPLENNQPLNQTHIFLSNRIPQTVITQTQSQDQNSDNQPSTPTILHSSNRSQTVRIQIKQPNNSLAPQISPVFKLTNTQNVNFLSFGLPQLKKENQQKQSLQLTNNLFSFTQDQLRQQNLHLNLTREKEIKKEENDLQVTGVIQRNFSFGNQMKTTPKNYQLDSKQQITKYLFAQKTPNPPSQREYSLKLRHLNQNISIFKRYLQNKEYYYQKICSIQEDIGYKISQIPSALTQVHKQIKSQSSQIGQKLNQNLLQYSIQQIQQKYKCMEQIAFKNVSYFVPLNKQKIKVKLQNKNRKFKSVQDKLWQKLKTTKLTLSSLKYYIQQMNRNIKQIKQKQTLIKQQTVFNIQAESKDDQQSQQCFISKIKATKFINVYLPQRKKEPIWELGQL